MKTKQKQWGKILAVFALFGVSLFAAQPSYAALTDGLVAYYSFNNCTANDNSGHGHDGVANGGTSCEIGAQGKAFSFNGVDSNFAIPSSPDFDIQTGAAFSVWIKPTIQSGVGSYILNKWVNGMEDKAIILSENGTAGVYLFQCMNLTSLQSTSPIPLNKWTLVTANYDGNKVSLYINGVLDSEVMTTPACDISDDIGTFYIGDNPERRFEGGVPFQGKIDEARVYNRALTAAEITTLYNQSNPIQGTAPWKTGHTVTCQNITQNKSVVIPKTIANAWDCEKAGLAVNHGDKVKVTIDGTKF